MSNTRLTRLSACGLLLASFYMRPAGQWQRRLALYPYIALAQRPRQQPVGYRAVIVGLPYPLHLNHPQTVELAGVQSHDK